MTQTSNRTRLSQARKWQQQAAQWPCYLTRAAPCPYRPQKWERKLVVPLLPQDAAGQYHYLREHGFRRSQMAAWVPACEDCSACQSLRILAQAFRMKPHWRRVWARNKHLRCCERDCARSEEHFALFQKYLRARHQTSQMAQLTQRDYAAMLAPSCIPTDVLEYRAAARLVGVMLRDRLQDGVSLVYGFFDPDMDAHSLGSYMILHSVLAMQAAKQPYVYLGYWIAECKSMAYKTRWTPYEVLGRGGWQRHD